MKILNIFSKNNVASDTFKEVSEFMETSDFEKQVRNLIKSLKIQEEFLMKSEILVIDYSESTTEESIFLELMLIALKPYFQYLFLQKNKIRTYYS